MLILTSAAPAPQLFIGNYWSAPEQLRLSTRRETFHVAGPAARELDRLLARAAPRLQGRAARVTICATVSPPGRYGHMGRHRRQLSLMRLLRVVDPRGRVLVDRRERC